MNEHEKCKDMLRSFRTKCCNYGVVASSSAWGYLRIKCCGCHAIIAESDISDIGDALDVDREIIRLLNTVNKPFVIASDKEVEDLFG